MDPVRADTMRIWIPGLVLLCLLLSCVAHLGSRSENSVSPDAAAFDRDHFDRVQKAEYCASCHPAEVEEHRANTHGRAFLDPEARMATGHFTFGSCVACHTPRPVFETGIGMNPLKRTHHLEEGNSCLTCHQRGGYDMAQFRGGRADCEAAFDPRVGSVEACASCHKNHGTPYQWEHATNGNLAGRNCIDCHMPFTVRPPATGEEPRRVRRHTFFAGHSESQVRRAYAYSAKLEGNEVVVAVENRGAGHNFPTELKQRSVESLVLVFDREGREVARSRMVFRDPYKRPYGLNLPVNTQIPSGESREHRVPVPIADGVVETSLFFKKYFPIEDTHPTMSLRLETKTLPFAGITPSQKPITTPAEVHAALPESIDAQAASPGNLADFPHPKIGKVDVEIPDGSKEGDIDKLIGLFQWPVPQANRAAVDSLVKIGEKAVPKLIEALGSWDNKTWPQSQEALTRIGAPARPAILRAIESDGLFVRWHARELVARLGLREGIPILARYLSASEPLDRRGAVWALGELQAAEQAPKVVSLLEDRDPDVVAAAALALAAIDFRDGVPAVKRQLGLWPMVETKRDLAFALGMLGDAAGAEWLLSSLDYEDDLVRETIFQRFFDLTGKHEGYHPGLEPKERAHAIARLRAWWEASGGKNSLRRPRSYPPMPLRSEIQKLVATIGGNDFFPDDPPATEKAMTRLLEIGAPALPQVIHGFHWPPGFAKKRKLLCEFLAATPDLDAVPVLLETLEDPVIETAIAAVRALGASKDRAALAAVKKFDARFESLASTGRLPALPRSADSYRVEIARVLFDLGEERGLDAMLRVLWTGDEPGRALAERELRRFCDESEEESPTRVAEIGSQLARIQEERALRAESLRQKWETSFDAASRSGEMAKTSAQRLKALREFEMAEWNAMPLESLNPNALRQILRDSSFAEEEIASKIWEDAAFLEILPSETLVAASNPIVLESKPDLPQPGWLFNGAGVSLAPWKHYLLEMEFVIEKGGLQILHRYDANQADGYRSSMSSDAGDSSGKPVLAAGKTYRIRQRVWGNSIATQLATLPNEFAAESIERIGFGYRRGAIFVMTEPDSKVRILQARLVPIQ